MRDIDPLNKLFNLTPTETEKKQEVAPIETVITDSSLEDDFELARETIRSVIKTGGAALEDIADLAKNTESARVFEVMGQMMKTLSDNSKDLLDLNKKKREMVLPQPEETNTPQIGNQYNVAFIGTTNDILADIDDESDIVDEDKDNTA